MKIALFGASFDPPHLAHRTIAEQLLDQKIVDQVWLVPVKEHPFGKKLAPEEARLKMLEMMVTGMNRPTQVQINDYELRENHASISFITLTKLSQQFPEHIFSWVIGSDNVEHFAKWDSYQEMLRLFPFYVYPRKGSDQVQLLPGMKWIEQVPEVDISSTLIREKVLAGESLLGLVEPDVASYIKANHFYQEN